MMNLTLNDDQAAAFALLQRFALSNADNSPAMAVLEGFAGVGKTTLVAALVEALVGLRVAVMAPTNKAVAVLEAKLPHGAGSVEFGSLHSFLGLRMKEREDGTQTCEPDGRSTLHEYDLAIVDECSMVSESLFEAILRSKRQCRVLFVGDPAQLPPVADAGRESPVFRMVQMKTRLNTIVRQAQGNPIIAASVAVRQAIEQGRRITLPELLAAIPTDCPHPPVGVMSGGVQAIVGGLLFEHRNGRAARALAWRNKTVNAINAMAHAALYPDTANGFAPGECVVAQTEFRAERVDSFSASSQRVMTSEELTVVAVEVAQHPKYADISAYQLTMEADGGVFVRAYVAQYDVQLQAVIQRLWAEYRAAKARKDFASSRSLSDQAWALTRAFAPVRHTYAVTAHKSQGSTFETTFLDWDDLMQQRDDFEFNRMLYVALTRASTFMAIVVR